MLLSVPLRSWKNPVLGAICKSVVATLVLWEEQGRDAPALLTTPATLRTLGRAFPTRAPSQQLDCLPIRGLTLAQPLARSQQRSRLQGAPTTALRRELCRQRIRCAQKRCQGPAQPEPRAQPPLHGTAEMLTSSPHHTNW